MINVFITFKKTPKKQCSKTEDFLDIDVTLYSDGSRWLFPGKFLLSKLLVFCRGAQFPGYAKIRLCFAKNE